MSPFCYILYCISCFRRNTDDTSQWTITLSVSFFSLIPVRWIRLTLVLPVAYTETALITANKLWYFDFRVASGEMGRSGEGTEGGTNGRGRIDEFQSWDSSGATHQGPSLLLEPRGELWKEIENVAD